LTILNAATSHSLNGGPSFSFRNRAFRALWIFAWSILAAWTPPFFHPWRRFLLRVFGANIAVSARIYGSARVWYPPNLKMAPYSCIGPRVICYNMATISLGEFAIVSQGAHLCAGAHKIDDQYFQLYAEPIAIGSNAWIAADAFVGPGVTMGEGAVLGARSVAFKDLLPWTVYIGNPSREKRKRRH
jgi:putative colanic acid biosynthesis acetyltransferase WcaF